MPELAVGADAAQLLYAAGWPDNRHAVLIICHQQVLGRAASLLLLSHDRE